MRGRLTIIGAVVASAAACGLASAAPPFTPKDIRGEKVGNTVLWAHVFHQGKPSSGTFACPNDDSSTVAPDSFTDASASSIVFTPAPGFSADWTTALGKSFTTWNDAVGAPAYFSFGPAANTTMPRPSNRSDGVNYMGLAPLGGRTLAVTYTWSVAGAVVETDMFFNSKVGWAKAEATDTCPAGTAYDREAIGTHELGHSLGLDHLSSVVAATMYPSASAGETRKRTLTTGEAAAAGGLLP